MDKQGCWVSQSPYFGPTLATCALWCFVIHGKNRKSMRTIIRKWRSSAKEKAEMEGWLSANRKTGDVNPAITWHPMPPATTLSLRAIDQDWSNTHTDTVGFSYILDVCIHLLAPHWANLVLEPSGMVHCGVTCTVIIELNWTELIYRVAR